MFGLPALAGAVQLTSRLVVEPAVAVTVGAFGAIGGSLTSVSVIVTVVTAVPPLLSSAVTVTV